MPINLIFTENKNQINRQKGILMTALGVQCKFARLTLIHAIPTFNDLNKEAFKKTLLEKEKMLVTSIFSFSNNVFCPSKYKF